MEDEKIIELFFDRSEYAIAELSNKYGAVCRTVAMNVLNDPRDAEECINDAYLGVWNAIPPQRPDPLPASVLRIVRNIAINRYKHNSVRKPKGNYDLCVEELENCIPSRETVEDALDVSVLSGYIDEFLDSLEPVNRMIFVRRFWYMDAYEDIAKASGLKEGAVRTRLSRIKTELKKALRKRGVTI